MGKIPLELFVGYSYTFIFIAEMFLHGGKCIQKQRESR